MLGRLKISFCFQTLPVASVGVATVVNMGRVVVTAAMVVSLTSGTAISATNTVFGGRGADDVVSGMNTVLGIGVVVVVMGGGVCGAGVYCAVVLSTELSWLSDVMGFALIWML